MGGCCCCSSRRAEADRAPVYYYCPQDLEEHEPLSTTHDTSSVVSGGLLVDTNLETSTPGTYRAPPAPLPYDVGLRSSQTLPGNLENRPIKTDHVQPADSQPIGETDGRLEGSDSCQTLEKSDCKSKTDFEHEPPETEDEPSKVDAPIVSVTDDEEVCPTCLEEYDAENPRILTKCEHHFHLSCILEWMERSDTCPICDQNINCWETIGVDQQLCICVNDFHEIMMIDHMSSE